MVFEFHFIYFLRLKGKLNETQYMRRLLQQAAESYPNVPIRVAISEKHQNNPDLANISVEVIQVIKNSDKTINPHGEIKDGLVWQHLVSQVETLYIFAALDLVYFDKQDVNLLRMVSEGLPS